MLINANQFPALMLNRDQYAEAADEIWLQLGSPPAQVFNHQVNQELGAQQCRAKAGLLAQEQIPAVFHSLG